jgi:hypothetical protein
MDSRLVSHRTPAVSRCMRRIDGQLLVSGAVIFWPLVDQLNGGVFVKKRIYHRVIQRSRRGVRIVWIGAASRAHGLGLVQFVDFVSTFWAVHLGFTPAQLYGDSREAPKTLRTSEPAS